MRIGVGLPTSTPGVRGAPGNTATRGPELVEWARRAEAGPFTSLGVVDRLVYDSTDPLVALAAAAAVTTRVRLVTMVVIGPIRPPAVLAAQAASLDALSEGRLTLGVSLGARRDDYTAAGAEWTDRGRRLSDQLAVMREIWEDDQSGPGPPPPAARPSSSAGAAVRRSPGRPATPTAMSTAVARPGPSPPLSGGPGRRGPMPAGPASPNCGASPTSPSPTQRRPPPTCATTTPSPASSRSGWPPASSTPPRPSGNTSPATATPAATSWCSSRPPPTRPSSTDWPTSSPDELRRMNFFDLRSRPGRPVPGHPLQAGRPRA